MNNISSVKDKCYGCRSCEQVCPKKCIHFNYNEEGFLYPIIDEYQCINCGICVRCCPVNNAELRKSRPFLIYAFKNKNEANIQKSASGGAADVASRIIIREGGVVFGVAYGNGLKVKHIKVENEKDCEKLQSSKYVQSDICNTYEEARKELSRGRRVLFTGTPCQIAGLYSFLGHDYSDLITIDLICHGVPSPRFFERYLEYLEGKMGEEITYYNFRSKFKRNWGFQYFLKLKTRTKTETKLLSLDKYGKQFLTGNCYRECCYKCDYASINRVADITVGDFWGVIQSHPEIYSGKGISEVLINTNKGKLFFDIMKKNADSFPISIEDCLINQSNLRHPTIRNSVRDTFYKKLEDSMFIHNLKIGIQIKERIKAILPIQMLMFLKRVKYSVRKIYRGIK